jgi:hypothetical protein
MKMAFGQAVHCRRLDRLRVAGADPLGAGRLGAGWRTPNGRCRSRRRATRHARRPSDASRARPRTQEGEFVIEASSGGR